MNEYASFSGFLLAMFSLIFLPVEQPKKWNVFGEG
jgi:hypothetical protein